MNKASGDDGIPADLFQVLNDDAVKVLHSVCQQIWKPQQRPQDRKRSVFIPIPKKSNTKECSNYHMIVLISHTSKVMLKILQARLQQFLNRELPDVQAGFRKGRGARDQIANIHWILEKTRESRKTSTSSSLTMLKHLTLWITTNCGRFLEMGLPDHLSCLLRNLHANLEATGYGTTELFKIEKGVHQD